MFNANGTKRAVWLAVLSCCLAPWPSLAAAPEVEVRTKLTAMERLLSTSLHGESWVNYLYLKELRQQVDAASNVDPLVLEKVLTRLNSWESHILQRPPFVELRHAVQTWLESLPAPAAAELSDMAEAAKARYVPRQSVSLDVVQAKVLADKKKLEQFLTIGPHGAAWRNYLRLDELQEQLTADEPSYDVLNSIHRLFQSGENGLEMPAFSAVRTSLGQYLDMLYAVDSPETREEYNAQLGLLQGGLKQIPADPQTASAEIGKPLAWLESAGQVPWLLAAVRKQYNQPNLLVRVSESLLTEEAPQAVDDRAPVRDVILGTQISGQGHTVGQVRVEMVPNPNQAEFQLVFNGTTQSRTVGRNGPAIVHSAGNTQFTAKKSVYLDADGVTSTPTTSRATTSTQTLGVGTTIRIPIVKGFVQRAASKQVAEKKSQGEYIGARHAEQRISNRFDENAGERISTANDKFQDILIQPLKRRGLQLTDLIFRTTDHELFMSHRNAERNQLAAPSQAPSTDPQAGLSVRLHESWLNNSASLFAGQTFNDKKLKPRIKELLGRTPPEWEEETEEERQVGTITFADEAPITLQVADGQATLTVRAKEFTRGEKTFMAMNITAAYKVEPHQTGLKLVRQDRLTILPPGFVTGEDKLTYGETVVVSQLRKTFDKIFKEEIITKTISLSDAKDKTKAGQLVMNQMLFENGWAALDWRHLRPGQTVALPAPETTKAAPTPAAQQVANP